MLQMKIIVNNEEVVFDGTTVAELLAHLGVSAEGIAVAAGTKIVPAAAWGDHLLSQNDNITIIRATQGG